MRISDWSSDVCSSDLENPHLDHFPSLVAMFFDRAGRGGEDPFLWRKADRAWHPLSWRQVANQVAALAHNLRELGLKEGDRVVLVSENRPEWCIADLGIMASGCITVQDRKSTGLNSSHKCA